MSEERSALHVFLVAGEESGDRLGAPLMRELKAKTGGNVRFSGIGGDMMKQEGLASLFPIEATAIMGFGAVPLRIRSYVRQIRATAAHAVAAKPDVVVIIDSPEFTHRIAKRVRAQDPDIPIIDYVCPSVWAWRPWRARAMRRYIDHVLALLPFEPSVLSRLGGPPSSYVGHPVSERAQALRPNADDAKRRETAPALVLIMPGSRAGEITRLLPIFQRAVEQLAERAGDVEFVLPVVPALADRVRAAVANWRVPVRIVDDAEKDAAFREARLAIVKSGTSTLELAVAGVPMVAVYKVSAIEAFLAPWVLHVKTVILANLVLGEHIVPEFLHQNATAENLVEAAMLLFTDSPERRKQIEAFKRLDGIMEIGRAVPSERAAGVVLAYARKRA